MLDSCSLECVVLLMTAEGLWGSHFQPKRVHMERRQRQPAAFSAINLNWSVKLRGLEDPEALGSSCVAYHIWGGSRGN